MNHAQLLALLVFIQALLKAQSMKPHRRVKGAKKKHRKVSAKQLANRKRFAAFVKKHGRAPKKGEKL